ncbi:MAG: 3'-5' exonuclease [Patescibacteria group bacterium]
MKIIYFDTETTGLNPVVNDIIQFAGIIEIDGEEKERFDFKLQPFSYENINQSAMSVHGITAEQLKNFDSPGEAYNKIISIFDKYIDKYDKNDKFIVCGYNVKFDVDFLKEFFSKNKNNYLFSYFGVVKDPLPVLGYLKSINKIDCENLKLESVCKIFGIEIFNAHNALADIDATRSVIKKVDEILNSVKL